MDIIDTGLNPISCTCTEAQDPYLQGDPASPMGFTTVIEIEYDGGTKIVAHGYLAKALLNGCMDAAVGEYGVDGVVTNPQVIAFLANALAELKPVEVGPIQLPSPEEAAKMIKRLGVTETPTDDRSAGNSAFESWMQRWKESGKLCEMSDGQWVIESNVAPEFAGHKIRHYVNGELVNYPGTTEYVELCTGVVKRAVDLTDDEIPLIADPAESDINAGRVDGKAEFERQQREGSGT